MLIEAHCPQLLDEPGCGPVTAAIIIGHTAVAKRFPTDACFARHAGTAPIPASSSNTQRHRLHRGGDRQLNRAIHVIALSPPATDPATRAYLDRRHAEGKTKREAIRCLKRHLARRILAPALHDHTGPQSDNRNPWPPPPKPSQRLTRPRSHAEPGQFPSNHRIHEPQQRDQPCRRRRASPHAMHALNPANSNSRLT